MAEYAIRSEDGCHPPSGWRQCGMSHCVHPLMHAMQPIVLYPTTYRSSRQSCTEKLLR
jgi:hypothetical protein